MAACSKTSNSSNPSSPSTAFSVDVSVDGRNPAVNEAFLSYFPATATVHPGDTVNFRLVDSGEPHTVTLGTLADAAVTAAQQSPDPSNPSATATATDGALPQLLPTGPGDAIQSAALPCFITSGAVPTATACTTAQQSPQPSFQGTEAYYNSGWLTPAAAFPVKLASNIKPGAYRYLCLLHREGMSGEIVVAPAGQPIPSASEQAAAGQAQLAKAIAALQPAMEPLASGKNPELTFIPSGPNAVLAGSGLQESNDAIDAFGPSTVTTTVNGTVTWYLIGPHTISFNAPPDVTGPRLGDTPHVNPKALGPSGGNGQGPPAAGAGAAQNGPPKIGETVDGKIFDGTNFHLRRFTG